jgi:hypothetical protein
MTSPDKPDDEAGSFLGRWSRRKLKPEPVAAVVPLAEPSPAAEADVRPRDPETGELIDEDLVARLPKLHEVEAGGDLSAFMNKGVPEALRREALRATWLSDPVIRNYVSPALDYAYDYNAPGGAPGYGPLTESDMAQAREFLANVFSTPPKTPDDDIAAHGTGSRDNESHAVAEIPPATVRLSHVAPQKNVTDAATASVHQDAREVSDTSDLPQSGEAAIVQRSIDLPVELPATPPRRRRGGGAAPV